MLRAYRLTQTRFATMAFNGEGAAEHGGRWNAPGTRMVYTSASLSLATLEMLVHVEDVAILDRRYTATSVTFDESLVRVIKPSTLPKNWNAPVIIPATQSLGSKWAAQMDSAILRVPSAVIEAEFNYLLNPAHPDFERIKIGAGEIFRIDARLKST